MKLDLYRATAEDIRQFVVAIVGMAAEDHYNGRYTTNDNWYRGHPARSGKKICSALCVEWRGFHEAMATGIYNKTRWSLKAAERVRS